MEGEEGAALKGRGSGMSGMLLEPPRSPSAFDDGSDSRDRTPRSVSPRGDISRSRSGDSQRSVTPRSGGGSWRSPRTGSQRSLTPRSGSGSPGDGTPQGGGSSRAPGDAHAGGAMGSTARSNLGGGNEAGSTFVDIPSQSRQESFFRSSRYSNNVATADVLMGRYGVPASRVVNVTPLLGRPMPGTAPRRKTAGKYDLQLAGSNLLGSSHSVGALPSSAPSSAGPGGRGVHRALSVGELRSIALAAKVPRPQPARREAPPPTETAEPRGPSPPGSPAYKQKMKKYRRRMRLRKPSRRPSKEASAPSVSVAETTVCDEGSDSEYGSVSPRDAAGPGAGLGDTAGTSHGHPGKKQELNPFKDYDEEGQRMQLERRWLLDDSWYMDLRLREFAHDGNMSKLSLKAKDPAEIYEESVYHGNYSMQVKANMALKAEIRRLRCESEAGSSPSCSIAEAKKTLSNTLPHFKKQLLTGTHGLAAETVQGKRSDRNAPSATVKLLKSMQKDLKDSNFMDRVPPPPPPPKEDPLLGLKGLGFGFGGK